MKKLLLAGLACLTAATCWAGTPKYNNYLANESGISYQKSYPLSLNANSIDNLSFQMNWATVTVSTVNFTDGSESTMTVIVTNNAGLSTATATDFLTVLTTNSLANACITLFTGSQTQSVCNGGRWRVDVTTDTAVDINTQMNGTFTSIISTVATGSSVVSSTAVVAGSSGNRMTLASNTSSITINTANFVGGQDAACLSINNTQFCGGNQFQVGTSSAISANNLSAAINTSLGSILTSTAPLVCGLGNACGVITATSTAVGTATNYALYTTTQPALTILQYTSSGTTSAVGAMAGGTNSAYTLTGASATATLILSTNPFSPSTTILGMPSNVTPSSMLAYPVLYSTGSATAIGGLVWGTTYYVIPVNNYSFGLASTSLLAVSGKFLTLTSSTAKTTADTFTLVPLGFSGAASGFFQASNDGINWASLPTASSPTFTIGASSSTVFDLGLVDYSWVQFKLSNPPTQGGFVLQVIPNGKNSGL